MRIFDKSGKEHIGRISRVTEDRVWLEPVGSRSQNSNYSNNRSSNRNRNHSNRNSRNFNNFNNDFNSPFRRDRDFRRDRHFGCGFFGCGFGFSIAIGFIAGIALAALFFF